MTDEDLREFVRAKCREIYEHCDAVQILVSYNEDELTHFHSPGCGNWYARAGMCQEFLDTTKAQTTANEIAKTREDE